MSQADVYSIVRSGGVPSGSSVAEWVAVAGAESSFVEDQVGDGGDSIGYWQINRANWSRYGVNATSLKDGRTNFRVAKQIWAVQGWAAWNATDGYRVRASGGGGDRNGMRLAADFVAEHAGQSTSLTSPQDLLAGAEGLLSQVPSPWNPAGAFQAVLDVVNRIGAWVSDPHNWVRVGYIAAGTLLVVVAGAAVASETKTGSAVVTAATKGAVSTRTKR